ncbi:hypothetical protein H9P43_000962 [Blastocladiella emersonii ATCC 22665]|nr:hypothetical protein H9P43_000962 [Blastocladiella emersonii ATCC 22665]
MSSTPPSPTSPTSPQQPDAAAAALLATSVHARTPSNPRPVPQPSTSIAGGGASALPPLPASNPWDPASLPRSHISQVLDNFLVSSSPRQRTSIHSTSSSVAGAGGDAASSPLVTPRPRDLREPTVTTGFAAPAPAVAASGRASPTVAERRRLSSLRGSPSGPPLRVLTPASPARTQAVQAAAAAAAAAGPIVPSSALPSSTSSAATPVPPPSSAVRAPQPPAVAGSVAARRGPIPDQVVADYVLDPSVGSPSHGLLGGFAVRDMYKYRERPVVNRLVHRVRSRSVPADLHSRRNQTGRRSGGDARVVRFDPSASGPRPAAAEDDEDDAASPNPAAPLHLIRARDLKVPGGFRRFYLLHMDPFRHKRSLRQKARRRALLRQQRDDEARRGRDRDRNPANGNALASSPADSGVSATAALSRRRIGGGGSSRGTTRRSNGHEYHYIMPDTDDDEAGGSGIASPPATPHIPTRSFFDFLGMYGNFGGASLWDEDELADWGLPPPVAGVPPGSAAAFGAAWEDEEVTLGGEPDDYATATPLAADERTALLASAVGGSTSYLQASSLPSSPLLSPRSAHSVVATAGPAAMPQGTANARKVFLLLIKSFIGTGVLFLPSAFRDGGLAFSFIFLILIAYLSAKGMLLLAKVNTRVPGSFGDIASTLYGPFMRYLVLGSIALSQTGFCTAYMVFIAQNTTSLLAQVTGGAWSLSIPAIIAIQVVLYIPLALVRKLKNFAVLSLIGDAFILLGLGVVAATALQTIADRGGVAPGIKQFNSESFALYIGTSVYTFEGVGLVIPIAQSMKRPSQFGWVLSFTMVLTTAVYLFIASVGYLAWGDDVQTIVLLNLPATSWSSAIFVLYILAIVFTWPLVLFPVMRIIEQAVLPHADGKASTLHKWQKNALRTALVVCIGVFAVVGSAALNKLVALIGSFACIPLSFLYPSMFHLRAFPDQGRIGRAADIGMFVFGMVAMIYVTYTTILI